MSDWLRDSYLTLVIWDAWRPVTVQKVVYDAYKEQLRHEHPHASEDELVMAQAGFMNYPEEWRHYDLGNRRWAAQTGRPAIYGPVEQV